MIDIGITLNYCAGYPIDTDSNIKSNFIIMTTKKRIRCKAALLRLQEQLKSGVKTEKRSSIGQKKFEKVPLTNSDIKRIEAEIELLKSKV